MAPGSQWRRAGVTVHRRPVVFPLFQQTLLLPGSLLLFYCRPLTHHCDRVFMPVLVDFVKS
jgi:hypothetical protein